MQKIIIGKEPITLGQFLKFSAIISSGGEVKFFLSSNDVFVNEIAENRRGRKLFDGDIVKINEKSYQIILSNDNR